MIIADKDKINNNYIAQDYFNKLAHLSSREILKGNVFYPLAGGDLFPAYFADCYGLDKFYKHSSYDIDKFKKDVVENNFFSRQINNLKGSFIPLMHDFFDYQDYFSQLAKAGGIDVLFIKGLSYWLSTYNLACSGKQCLFTQEDYAAIKIELAPKIEKIIENINNQLINDNGFIVLADFQDMYLTDFILDKLGYELYEDLAPLKFSGDNDALCNFDRKDMLGSFSVKIKNVPLRVFKK